MSHTCFIIPNNVLEKLSKDPELSEEIRGASNYTARLSVEIRKLREQALAVTSAAELIGPAPAALAPSPAVTVYDCQHHQTLPGAPVPNPVSSTDPTASRTFIETSDVAKFY